MELISLQLTMFALMLTGYFLRRRNIISEAGEKSLTDLVIDIVLPANTIKSFLGSADPALLANFGTIFLISMGIQIFCIPFGYLLYRKKPRGKKECLQYGIFCSNSGFLGNAVAESTFGIEALSLTSVYLIPVRFVMWSFGIAIFSGINDRKASLKKVLTHPCVLACFIGLALMLSQIQLPSFVVKTISYLGSCNTPLSMMVVGMFFTKADLKSFKDPDLFVYTLLRLVAMPALAYLVLSQLPISRFVLGVSVILVAMPAAATTSILANKYDANGPFATELVVFSTLCSLVTTPLWTTFLL
ncbi:MAG: AEC family transporter [Bulleidia sp.]|nr:AEC family transporter [Bulleidia sp.]